MESIKITDAPYEKMPDDFSLSEYLKGSFSMFSGHTGSVKLRLDNELINAVIDRSSFDRQRRNNTCSAGLPRL